MMLMEFLINNKKEKDDFFVIKSHNNPFYLNIREIIKYRDLIFVLMRRDFVAIYKQSILGPLWFILTPLFTTFVFTLVFGNIAKISTGGIPHILFYFSGIIVWNYFSASLLSTFEVFIANANIFGKVYFPRICVPIATTTTKLVAFFIQLVTFIILYLVFVFNGLTIRPNIYILFFPFFILQVALLSLGIGFIISSITTKYRDLLYLANFGVQLFMYITPIAYPLSQVPEKFKIIILLNPLTHVFEFIRYSLFGMGELNYYLLMISVIVTIILFLFGIIIFNATEKTFIDVV